MDHEQKQSVVEDPTSTAAKDSPGTDRSSCSGRMIDHVRENEITVANESLGATDYNSQVVGRELNELRAVFNDITGSKQELELHTILALPEVMAQLDAGDISTETLECVWLEAAASSKHTATGTMEKAAGRCCRGSWGVPSRLTFEGFISFLDLCEQRIPTAKDTETQTRKEGEIEDRSLGKELLAAKHHAIAMMRSTLTVHQRNETVNQREEGGTGGKSQIRGKDLHAAMVRSAVEAGLARHTEEGFHELERTGVYKPSAVAAGLERSLAKMSLNKLLSGQRSHDILVNTGILLEQTPVEHMLERAVVSDHVKHQLQKRSSLEELQERGVIQGCNPKVKEVERAFLTSKLKHNLEHRSNLEELRAQGIALDMAPGQAHAEHLFAGAQISRKLQSRPFPQDVHNSEVFHTPEEAQARSIEHKKVRDDLQARLERVDRPSAEDVVSQGILIPQTPQQLHAEHMLASRNVKRGLERRESLEDLKVQGLLPHHQTPVVAMAMASSNGGKDPESLLALRNVKHGLENRPSLEDLKEQGVYHSVMQARAQVLEHELAKDTLKHGLQNRADLSELEERGIYHKGNQVKIKMDLERCMVSDQINKSLRERPLKEDLQSRGLLEVSALQGVFKGMAESKGGGVGLQEVEAWPVLRKAVERKLLSVDTLHEAFADVAPDGDLDMTGFDQLLSGVFIIETKTQKDGEESQELCSLKRWVLEAMGPEIQAAEHQEAMHRRNALMAEAVDQALKKREPLEALSNQGIYLDKTPLGASVERAHLSSTLAHRLGHRSALEELTHKDIYLEGVGPDDLKEARRQARNTLEGALSQRSDLHKLEDDGYLEADELEEAFMGLLEPGQMSVPFSQLVRWGPVQALIELGTASEEDVWRALVDAYSSSKSVLKVPSTLNGDARRGVLEGGERGREGKDRVTTGGKGGQHGEENSDDIAVGFVGFLEFIHNLDLKVDGLDLEEVEGDSEEVHTHKKRLSRRRERSAQMEGGGIHHTLKEHLMAHLQSRPAKTNPETQRLAHEFHSFEAVSVEKKLLAHHLEDRFRSRPGPKEVVKLCRDMDVNHARVKELEFQLNRRLLLHRLSKRPGWEELVNKGVLHQQDHQQERLQRLLARDSLKHALHKRPTLEQVEASGVYHGAGSHAPMAFKLEHKLSGIEVAHALSHRPSMAELVSRGIIHERNPDKTAQVISVVAAKGQKGLMTTEEELKHLSMGEEARTAAVTAAQEGLVMHTPENHDRLVACGVLHESSVAAMLEREMKDKTRQELERHLVEDRLKKKLESAARPSLNALSQQGIYRGASPLEVDMQRYLAARNLKHGLEERETLEELKERRLFQAADGDQSSHEKLLAKALLNWGVCEDFSGEELSTLRRRGIYKNVEHAQLKAERALVASQLTNLLRERPEPAQPKNEHPGILEASMLALVFEERVMHRANTSSKEGGEFEDDLVRGHGQQRLVSLEALQSWPDVQEYISAGGKKAEHDACLYFNACDQDGDGFLNFSQFLRWVELCDLEPEFHIKVDDAELEWDFSRLAHGESSILFEKACTYRLVKRWALSASLDQDTLAELWMAEAGSEQGDVNTFKTFCHECEERSMVAHNKRLFQVRADAVEAKAKAKESLKARLVTKLTQRSDYNKLKEARVIKEGISPAATLLERNLISIHLKQQLLARSALEKLQERGIETSEEQVGGSLNGCLGADLREEVSGLLQHQLSKRSTVEELANKGIYIDGTEASYALLIHKVMHINKSFCATSGQLLSELQLQRSEEKT